jgi:hypothetical protein
MMSWIQATMLSLKTTATLIAALSVIATVSAVPALIPQAFAWIVADNIGNDEVTATQSNSATQTSTQTASQTQDDNNGDQILVQNSCQSVQQQNSAAGDDATNTASNSVVNC